MIMAISWRVSHWSLDFWLMTCGISVALDARTLILASARTVKCMVCWSASINPPRDPPICSNVSLFHLLKGSPHRLYLAFKSGSSGFDGIYRFIPSIVMIVPCEIMEPYDIIVVAWLSREPEEGCLIVAEWK